MVLAENLRQAVLQAAIQGKLTERSSTDTNIQNTLLEISDKRKYLNIDKKLLLPKKIDLEEVPFEIPPTWTWIRLGSICEVITKGSSPKWQGINYTENGLLFVTSENVGVEKLLLSERKYVEEKFDKISPRSSLKYGDLLTNIVGASIGRTALYDLNEKANINQAVCVIRLVNIEFAPYIMKYMNSNTAYKIMMEDKVETARPNISLTNISDFLIPLPPIEEQKRIVDKINEIMPKIDEYEKIEKELEALKKEFPTNMKDALLQAAMQGKLTEQLESDSSVDELLETIRQEKEELIAQKKVKMEKPLPDIEGEEIPFDIPENWRWVRLGNVGTLTRGNGIKRNEVTEVGFPCVRYGELYTTYKTKFDVAVSHTSQEIFNKSQKVHTNNILMALTGENNFDIALALAYLGEEVIAMGGDLTRWSNHHMNPLYLVYVMNSSYAIHKKSEMAKGDIIVHISNDKLATILLPIPPIEEQNRIVERLEALLPLCEELKEV